MLNINDIDDNPIKSEINTIATFPQLQEFPIVSMVRVAWPLLLMTQSTVEDADDVTLYSVTVTFSEGTPNRETEVISADEAGSSPLPLAL